MKANIVILATLAGLFVQGLFASNLDRMARFEAIYSNVSPVEAEEELPPVDGEEEAPPSEDNQAPTDPVDESQPPVESETDTPPAEEEQPPADPIDDGQDQGEDWASLSLGEFVQKVYSFSSLEKYRAAKQYITGRELNRNHFQELFEALKVSGLRPLHSDPLLGLYISLSDSSMRPDQFLNMLKEFSPKAFRARTKEHNWPLQSAVHYIENSDIGRFEIWAYTNLFKLAGMNTDFVDEELLQAYMSKNAAELSVDQLERTLATVTDNYESVQRKAILVNIYLRANIENLENEDFREDFEEVKQTVPFDMNIQRVRNMPTDARQNLYYAEYEFFKGFWTRDLFFTLNHMMNLFEENVPVRDHKRLVNSFIERNSHRLNERQIEKLSKRFL